MYIQSKLLQHKSVVGASSGQGRSFCPRQNRGLGEEKNKVIAMTLAVKEHYCPVSNHGNES